MKKRSLLTWGVAIVCFVVLMLVTPSIPQSQEYHDFADQRKFLGNCHLPSSSFPNIYKSPKCSELGFWIDQFHVLFFIFITSFPFGILFHSMMCYLFQIYVFYDVNYWLIIIKFLRKMVLTVKSTSLYAQNSIPARPVSNNCFSYNST